MKDRPRHSYDTAAANRRAALRLALGYAGVAMAWILASDMYLGWREGLPPHVVIASESKGALFVAVTAGALFFFAFRMLERMSNQEQRIRDAYVDVLGAATGGKFELMSDDEIAAELGTSLGAARTIDDPSQLADARAYITSKAAPVIGGDNLAISLLTPVGEALNNAIRHAGGGTYEVYEDNGCIQVAITDDGPGIDFSALPQAVLVSGFSTSATLGMGFTMMLRLSRRVLLSTRPGHTTVVIESEGSFADEEDRP